MTGPVTGIVYIYIGIVSTYIYTVQTKIYNRHETAQTPTSQPHYNILVHYFLMILISTTPAVTPSGRSFVPHHQYDKNTPYDTYDNNPTHGIQSYQHTTMNPHNHLNITSTLSAWNELWPTMTPRSPDIPTYTHGLVSTLPPTNYNRATMNHIDHIYIGILSWSNHATINRYILVCLLLSNNAHTSNSSHPRKQYRTLWIFIEITPCLNQTS